MINTQSLDEAKKRIRSSITPVVIRAQGNAFNRKMLEYGKFAILLSPESRPERQSDIPKQLDSGMNHVLARIATKNNVAIGIDVKEIAGLQKMVKALRLSRVRQNILVCRRAKTVLAVVNVFDEKEGQQLLLSLGASTQQAKEALILV